MGHEAFHWLRHSRQIPGANYETQANQYGFAWLDEWRKTMASPTNPPRPGSIPVKQTPDDASFARVFLGKGNVLRLCNPSLAYTLWLGLRRGIRAAFRRAGDRRPVYPWDYADMP